MLATLVAHVELQRGDLKKGGELSTCLGFEDCTDKQVVASKDYLDMGISLSLGSMVEGKA
jgi:hypothetical protein